MYQLLVAYINCLFCSLNAPIFNISSFDHCCVVLVLKFCFHRSHVELECLPSTFIKRFTKNSNRRISRFLFTRMTLPNRRSSSLLLGINAAPVDDENMFVWNALIDGPVDTCYEDGLFTLRLEFSGRINVCFFHRATLLLLDTYPITPPSVRFTCKMFHPNGRNEVLFFFSLQAIISNVF